MAASPRHRALLALSAAALLTGCGAHGPDYTLATPPPAVGGAPARVPARPGGGAKLLTREPQPSQHDAERLRPVLSGWASAVRRGDVDRASRYFAVPAIVARSRAFELENRDEIRNFNDQLPCGERLVAVRHDGRYVVGTFRLTQRSGHDCTASGQLARVAFVIRGHRFTEWREVPDRPGASPGPAEREPAPPLGQQVA